MPRMRAVVTFSDVVDVTVRPGVNACRFLMSVTPPSLSCCADRAMTEMGTSWMFCSRFCAVTMISVKTGGFAACCCAQLEPAAPAPDIANTRATPCRKGTRRIAIAPPLPSFLIQFLDRGDLSYPLWTDRHNISESSLREG